MSGRSLQRPIQTSESGTYLPLSHPCHFWTSRRRDYVTGKPLREVRINSVKGTHHSWRQDVVEILQEGFLLNLLIGEDESDPFTLVSSNTVQILEILEEVVYIVRSEEQISQTCQPWHFNKSTGSVMLQSEHSIAASLIRCVQVNYIWISFAPFGIFIPLFCQWQH